MSQYSHLSEPDPELPFIPALLGPISPDLVPTLRQGWALELPKRLDRLRPHLPAGTHHILFCAAGDVFIFWSDSEYAIQNHTTAVQDGEICIRTISPTPTQDEDKGFPVLVYFHGGGQSLATGIFNSHLSKHFSRLDCWQYRRE